MQISWFIPKIRKYLWEKTYNYNKALASSWIRCLQLMPYMRNLGVKSLINKYDSNTQVAVFLRRWSRKDLAMAKILKRKGVRIILDTPVNYFSNQDLPTFNKDYQRDFQRFANFADKIFCPSPFIQNFGQKLGFNISLIEDSIDLKHFCHRKVTINRGNPTLIWSGVSVKARDLNLLTSTIEKNKWKMIIISNKRPNLGFSFEFIKWDYYSFPQSILKGDIAVFPRRTDNEYDLGHSFFKIGVFLAQQIPVICSPVPSYKQIINSSNAISLPSLNPLSWEEKIKSIISREKVFDFNLNPVFDFSSEKIAIKYHKIITNLLLST